MDVEKLNRIIENEGWRESLVSAMRDRSLFGNKGMPSVGAVRDGSGLLPVLSYPGDPRPELAQFVQVTFDRGDGAVRIGDAVSPSIRESLEQLSAYSSR